MFGKTSMLATILWLAAAISVVSLTPSASAQGRKETQDQLLIDCVDPVPQPYTNVFPSFAAYLQQIGPIGTVSVKGPCPGNFLIWGGDNFTIVGPAEIDGNISIGHSESAVFLQNLTITNSSGDGIDISGSKVSLDSCDVSNNAGNGVSVDNASHVVVVGSGRFDDNRGWAGGFHVGGHSFLNIAPSGRVEIRGNSQSGIWASQSDIQIIGNTVVSDNVNGPGLELLGGARAQVGNNLGTPNVIQNNPKGGIDARENSQVSLFTCCSNPPNVVRANGQFGIQAGFHSQVTLSGADVLENTGPGVYVFAGSQLDFFPGTQNRVDRNGTLTDPTSAGIRIDGNSEAWLRDGEISSNLGVGVRIGMNSSLDIAGVSLVGNTGSLACDFTSTIAADFSFPFSSSCIVVRRNP